MLMADIKRVKYLFQAESETNEANLPSLSDECEEVLGFRLPDKEEKKSTYEDALQEALAKLEISVLDWRDVMRYQAYKQQQLQNRLVAESTAPNIEKWPWNGIPNPEWRRTSLNNFINDNDNVIPAHVLLKAIQIKRACPEVTFQVEYLDNTKDPFLRTEIKDPEHPNYDWYNHIYYIEVWDEPKFERTIGASGTISF